MHGPYRAGGPALWGPCAGVYRSVKSKGEVLRFAWEQLSRRGYDAVCVFDADNLADPSSCGR